MDAILLATLRSMLEKWDIASVAYSEFIKFYPDKITEAESEAHDRLCDLMATVDRICLTERLP